MPTSFNCPACGQMIAAEVTPGNPVICPLCNQEITVPGVVAAVPAGGGGTPAVMPQASVRTYPMSPKAVSQGMAIGALVCGIVGLVGCPLVGLVGLILGIVAVVRVGRNPEQYGGRGLAIGGICTGALSIMLIPLLIAILLPSLSRAREIAKITVCSANMAGIGQALYIYAQDEPDGLFPEQGCDWATRLVNAGYTTRRQFICPSDYQTTRSSYYYVPGYGTSSNPRQIILYERPDIHGGEGGNILYQDCHVEFVSSPEFEEAIDAITLPDGTPWAPHEEPEDSNGNKYYDD